jgi:hypothetical protein
VQMMQMVLILDKVLREPNLVYGENYLLNFFKKNGISLK